MRENTNDKSTGRFKRRLQFLVRFFIDWINCARGNHAWELKNIHVTGPMNIRMATTGWACKHCDEVDLGKPLDWKPNRLRMTFKKGDYPKNEQNVM